MNESVKPIISPKSVHLLLTVKELFSLLFMRAVAVNPNASYSLVRHKDKTYISSTQSVNQHQFFKSKKIHRIRKFMGQALVGISVENPVDSSIVCPVVSSQVTISANTPGIDAVCPLAYQDDLNLMEGIAIDRRPVFDKYGRAQLTLRGKAASEGTTRVQRFSVVSRVYNGQKSCSIS